MMLLKTFDSKASMDDRERSITARISTAAVDRDGDVMLPSGIDMSDYRKNPVVLFGHDAGSLPIGKAAWMKKTPNEVVAKTVLAKRPDEHPAAAEWVPDTIYSLFKQEILRAFSVGFTIEDAREADRKDVARFGENVRRIISKWKLLEFSVVPIPANQDALAMAVSKGMVQRDSWTLNEMGYAEWGEPSGQGVAIKMPRPLSVTVKPLRIRT